MIDENNDHIHDSNYVEYARTTFKARKPELAKRLEKLSDESVYMLNTAFKKIETVVNPLNTGTRTIDSRRIVLEVLDRVVSNDSSFNILMNFPAHMKMQLSTDTEPTPELRMRKVEAEKDMRLLYREKHLGKIYKNQLGEDQILSDAFTRNAITCRIKHSGSFSETVVYDSTFDRKVMPENTASNLFVVPMSIDVMRDTFSTAQLDNIEGPKEEMKIYLDIVPATKQKGIWIYPDHDAFKSKDSNAYKWLPQTTTSDSRFKPTP